MGAHEWGRGREREREGERIQVASALSSTDPDSGLNPMNCEIMASVEIKGWSLNLLSHPGATNTLSYLQFQNS